MRTLREDMHLCLQIIPYTDIPICRGVPLIEVSALVLLELLSHGGLIMCGKGTGEGMNPVWAY
jgi:hypothetical protein